MFRLGAVGLALAGASLAGGAGCGPLPDERLELRLHLASARACRPAELDGVRLVALGDFGAGDDRVVEAPADAPFDVARFPRTTLAVRASARDGGWEGLAVVPLDEAARTVGRDGLLLPPELPCPSPDPEARAPRGAAVTALADGSIVVVGGLGALGRATRRVVRLPLGLEVATVEPRMPFNPVAFATVTAIEGSTLVVAGGASAEAGEVRDTFEVLALDGEPPRAPGGTLAGGPRRDHAAVLVGGAVLLVGGSDGVSPLDTLERIAPDAARSTLVGARLVRARLRPVVVLRADGSLVVAGGSDGSGPVGSIEIVEADLSSSREVRLEPPLPSPRWIAVLAGPRLLWASAAASYVVMLDGEPEVARLDLVAPTPAGAVATGLSDGRALVVGGAGPSVEIAVVDASAGTVAARRPSRGPGVLVARRDGVVVELDDDGATFRREGSRHPFDAPEASWQLPADLDALALDAGSRWEAASAGGRGVRARVDGARLDVPVLRLASARIEVDLEGEGEILFTSEAGVVGRVAVGASTLAVGACEAPRPSGSVVLVRTGARVELVPGTSCDVPGLPERVGVAVRGRLGARVRAVALARLE